MSWRLAVSLDILRAEVDTLAPVRSKSSDGTIGDPAHADRPSDHNPNPAEVVCALDLTHDPAGGADMHTIAEDVRSRGETGANPVKYVIWDGRIASAKVGWEWVAYFGSNPHTKHMHVSVGVGPDGQSTGPYDDPAPWGLLQEDDMFETDDRATLDNVSWGVLDPEEGLRSVVASIATQVAGIAARLDTLEVGGGVVDVDAVAEAVAGKLADRLQS